MREKNERKRIGRQNKSALGYSLAWSCRRTLHFRDAIVQRVPCKFPCRLGRCRHRFELPHGELPNPCLHRPCPKSVGNSDRTPRHRYSKARQGQSRTRPPWLFSLPATWHQRLVRNPTRNSKLLGLGHCHPDPQPGRISWWACTIHCKLLSRDSPRTSRTLKNPPLQ